MAPSAKKLEQALGDMAVSIWKSADRSKLTTNLVRTRAAEKLGLQKDFFKKDAWADRSKGLIKEKVDELEAGESGSLPGSPKPQAKAKTKAVANTSAKRKLSGQAAGPTKKRQKKAEMEEMELDDVSELSEPSGDAHSDEDEDEDEDEVEVAPKKKAAKSTKAAAASGKGAKTKKKAKSEAAVPASEPESEEESELSSLPSGSSEKSDVENESDESAKPAKTDGKAAKTDGKAAKKKAKNDEGSRLDADKDDADEDDATTNNKPNQESTAAAPQTVPSDGDSPLTDAPESEKQDDSRPEKPQAKEADATGQTGADDSSELSDVMDESPPPKRKSKAKDKSEKGSAKDKSKKGTAKTPAAKKKKAANGAAADLSPDEVEIKRLQGQLVKCGVRKIWGIELRGCQDDLAKIRHLQGMLRDIGLEGRFSEAKAESIRMRRELMADVEGLTEMNKNWKGGRGGRARGRTIRSARIPGSSEEEEEEEEDTSSRKPQKGKADGDGDGDDKSAEDSDAEKPMAVRGGIRRRADLAFLDDDDEDSD